MTKFVKCKEYIDNPKPIKAILLNIDSIERIELKNLYDSQTKSMVYKFMIFTKPVDNPTSYKKFILDDNLEAASLNLGFEKEYLHSLLLEAEVGD